MLPSPIRPQRFSCDLSVNQVFGKFNNLLVFDAYFKVNNFQQQNLLS